MTGGGPNVGRIDGKPIRLRWTDLDSVPVVFANQLLVQVDASRAGNPDTVLLTVGVATPPLALGATREELEEALESVDEVPIRPIIRLAIGVDHVAQWSEVLSQTAQALAGWNQGKEASE